MATTILRCCLAGLVLATLLGLGSGAAAQTPGTDPITRWFRSLDASGDGKLSATELPNQRLFRRADRDADGYVTLEEAAALRRLETAASIDPPGKDRPVGERPNLVLVLADDLGYADVGFHGCPDVPTPHIDGLARDGIRFRQAYVTGSVCSPSRAGLITGRYQQRFGYEFNTGGLRDDFTGIGLPPDERTIADWLQAAGYVSGVIGKWHLGRTEAYHPITRGFDRFFGFLTGARPYWPDERPRVAPILRGLARVDETEYLTDAFAREAEAFIARHAEQPFFLYLAFNAVHTPMQAKPADRRRFLAIRNRRRRTYAGMLAALDRAVGRVRGALRAKGLEKNTLIVFLGDNGGPTRVNGSSNDPLRGGKGTLFEGGVRVPFALAWKGRLPANRVYDDPVTSLDLLPTLAGAAGVRLKTDRVFDGVDLMPFVTGKQKGRPHRTLHWREGEMFAVRHGDWKLTQPTRRSAATALYDLSRDPAETEDRADEHPEIAEELLYAARDLGEADARTPLAAAAAATEVRMSAG